MRSKLRSTVSVYEAQIDRLRHQVEDFRTEAEAQSKTAEREWPASRYSGSHA